MPVPADYRARDLFLLVGGNPLPAYVAARLLGQPGPNFRDGRLFLIATGGTNRYRRALRRELLRCGYDDPDRVVDITVAPAEPKSLGEAIRTQWRANQFGGSVGLHYTGGTKAMTALAYQAVRALAGQADVRFSYLDARDRKLIVHHANGEFWTPREATGLQPGIVDAADELADGTITLGTLFSLHDMAGEYDVAEQPHLPLSAAMLARHAQAGTDEWAEWRRWSCRTLRPGCDADPVFFPEDLANQPVTALPDAEAGRAVRAEIGAATTFRTVDGARFGDARGAFARWLDGEWLRDHVATVLDTLQRDQPALWGDRQLAVQRHGTVGQPPWFDVALVRGYQLFAVAAIGSADPERCQQRLFTAVNRAERLGGAEARVALVCLVDDPEPIEHLISALIDPDLEPTTRRVRVFGRPQLEELPELLRDWLERLG